VVVRRRKEKFLKGRKLEHSDGFGEKEEDISESGKVKR